MKARKFLSTPDRSSITSESRRLTVEKAIIPKTKAAGLDMVMLDDYWNVTRDSIEPSAATASSASIIAAHEA